MVDVEDNYAEMAKGIDLEKVLRVSLETVKFLASILELEGGKLTITEWILVQGLIKDAFEYKSYLNHVEVAINGMLNT